MYVYTYVYIYMYIILTDVFSIAFDAQVIFLQMAGIQRDQGQNRTAEQPIALLRDCMFQAHIVCRVEGLQQSSHDLLQVPRN